MHNFHQRERKVGQGLKIGFDTKTITIPIDEIIMLKVIPQLAKDSRKYKQIYSSIKEVGVIEPPIIGKKTNLKGKYLLLDGHLRISILRDMGETEVNCIVSVDDESFTYNRYINRLSPIQENRMIVKAIERGVAVNKIAKALGLDPSNVTKKRMMLRGICNEAVEILKDKMVNRGVFDVLRKMKPVRQIEVAILMHDSNIYNVAYAKALLAATPKEKILKPDSAKKIKGLDSIQMARMESEMTALDSEYKLIEENYGTDILNLTIAKGYLTSLLGNVKIVRFLSQGHKEILTQFQEITDMKSLI